MRLPRVPTKSFFFLSSTDGPGSSHFFFPAFHLNSLNALRPFSASTFSFSLLAPLFSRSFLFSSLSSPLSPCHLFPLLPSYPIPPLNFVFASCIVVNSVAHSLFFSSPSSSHISRNGFSRPRFQTRHLDGCCPSRYADPGCRCLQAHFRW